MENENMIQKSLLCYTVLYGWLEHSLDKRKQFAIQ